MLYNIMIIISYVLTVLNSFLASSEFCRLQITFVNSLDPDQDRNYVGPDLDPNWFDTITVFLKEHFEKKSFWK